MTLAFENNNDVIVYTLEKIISYARDNQYSFVAQCVWWLASIIGLQEGLVIHINNLRIRSRVEASTVCSIISSGGNDIHPARRHLISSRQSSDSESGRQDTILRDCEQFLLESEANRKAICKKSRKQRRKDLAAEQRKSSSRIVKSKDIKMPLHCRLEGIKQNKIDRQRIAGECLRCAWPQDRKRYHRASNCCREIRRQKGTAPIKELH